MNQHFKFYTLLLFHFLPQKAILFWANFAMQTLKKDWQKL